MIAMISILSYTKKTPSPVPCASVCLYLTGEASSRTREQEVCAPVGVGFYRENLPTV